MFWNALMLAFRSISRNPMRSFLTCLGIIIGVSAVITMVNLGNGATKKVREQISSLGTNLLQLRTGQPPHGPGGIRAEARPFKMEDIEYIKREVYGIEAVAPVSGGATVAIYGNKNWSTTVTGSTNDFFDARDWQLSIGRRFTEAELKAGKAVCVLGSTVAKELFEDEEAVGKTIRLKKIAFEVIGVLESKGESTFGTDMDDIVLIPITTYHRRIAGNTDVERAYISVLEGYPMDVVMNDITSLMRQRRRVTPGEPDDFHVRDMKEIGEVLSGTTSILTSLLGAIAAVSLIVGGIGIMNIMLVSVTERTREIGTRLAIGALERDVLLQFLVEAVVLSSIGGVTGIILSIIVTYYLARLLLVPVVISPWIIIIAFSFSLVIGISFGYYPARKAARLNPIEALRHE
ncbi:MAG: ABC transporter permease [Thermodesulfovibrionia bacterium]